jgi:hypothetical protein
MRYGILRPMLDRGKVFGFTVRALPLVSLLVTLLVGGLAACSAQEEGEETLCLEDCTLCADNVCPDDRCGLLIILSVDCKDEVEFAEVAVDNCVEEETLEPESSLIPCATIKKNESRVVTVRADNWVWRKTVTCGPADAGGIIPVALYCIERQ